MKDPKKSCPEFRMGDTVKIKDSSSKSPYGEYGIVIGVITLMDRKLGEYVWQYQVAYKDGDNERRYDYLYFFEGELEHSAWDTKLGELL